MGIDYLIVTGEAIGLINTDSHRHVLPPAFDEPLPPPGPCARCYPTSPPEWP